jgi:Mg-chelatase subunit ChlD
MSKRDYTLIIDRSGSMAIKDQAGGRSRWATARESAHALAAKCDELDPDGITLYVFGSKFRRYDNVTAERVGQVFLENEPCGGTDLAGVLSHAFDSYFQRKRAGDAKTEGETIVVVTDGEPDDQKAVMKTIVEATRRIDRDEELGVSLVQVGTDPLATRFLKALDDDLVKVGAKFDICDTITLQEMEDLSLTEVLLRAIHD